MSGPSCRVAILGFRYTEGMGLLNEIGSEIIVGILGIFATLAWMKIIYPGIVEYFVEPTKLAVLYGGTLDFGRGPNHRIQVTLRKRGRGITGSLRFTEGRNAGKEYGVQGRYSHGLLTFVYWPLDKASTSQGTATFQRLQDGALFRGQFAYYSQEGDKVAAVQCELKPQ